MILELYLIKDLTSGGLYFNFFLSIVIEVDMDNKEEWLKSVNNRQVVDSNRRVEFYCPIPLLKVRKYALNKPMVMSKVGTRVLCGRPMFRTSNL